MLCSNRIITFGDVWWSLRRSSQVSYICICEMVLVSRRTSGFNFFLIRLMALTTNAKFALSQLPVQLTNLQRLIVCVLVGILILKRRLRRKRHESPQTQSPLSPFFCELFLKIFLLNWLQWFFIQQTNKIILNYKKIKSKIKIESFKCIYIYKVYI